MADITAEDRALLAAARQRFDAGLGRRAGDGNESSDPRQSSFLGDVVGRKAIGQGLLFGFGDEAAALARSTFGSETYDDALAAERAKLRQVEQERPWASMVAEGVGSVAPALAAGPLGIGARVAATGARAGMGAVGRGTAAGAAAGAVSGFGQGEGGFSGRIDDAATGALLGGGLGAAAGGLAGGASSLLRRLDDTPDARGADAVIRKLDADGLTPEGVKAGYAARQAAGGAKPETVLDLHPNSNTAGLFETAVNRPSEGREAVADAMRARMEGMGGRLADDHAQALGNVRGDARVALDEWMEQRRAASAPLWAKVDAHGEVNDAEINTILRRVPDPVLRDVDTLARLDGMDPERMIARSRKAEENGRAVQRVPTAAEVAKVGEALGDAIGEAKRQGKGALARKLSQTKSELLARLDEIVPDYKAAREAWAGPSALRDAAEEGMAAFSKPPEEIRRTIAKLSDSERNAYAIGARQAIDDRLRKVVDGRDASNATAGMTEMGRDKLEAVLHAIDDDPAKRTEFADRLFASIARERGIAENTGRTLGNSRTAYRQAADADDRKGDGLLSSVVVDALTGSPGIATGMNVAQRVLRGRLNGLGERFTARADAERSGGVLRYLGGMDEATVGANMDALAARRDATLRANAAQSASGRAGLALGNLAGGWGAEAPPEDPRAVLARQWAQPWRT